MCSGGSHAKIEPEKRAQYNAEAYQDERSYYVHVSHCIHEHLRLVDENVVEKERDNGEYD